MFPKITLKVAVMLNADEIFSQLEKKGFASENVLLGCGSYSLGMLSKDYFNIAIKATNVVINGEEKNIFKNPATDKDKFKKSQTGYVVVICDSEGKLVMKDGLSFSEESRYENNCLQTVFKNGVLTKDWTFQEIRNLANSQY